MTTESNRLLTPISTKAHQHMKRIVAAHKKRGLPESNTHWLSELILSQPLPNGNGAHYIGKDPSEGDAVAVVNEEGKQ